METILQSVPKYMGYNLSVIPMDKDQRPAGSADSYKGKIIDETTSEQLFLKPEVSGIGIICGKASANLVVLEVDCSHAENLWGKFKAIIKDQMPKFLKCFVIASANNKKYYLFYRCDGARRGMSIALDQQERPLMRTIGEGDYVIAPPSPGYKFLQGDLSVIPDIHDTERMTFLGILKREFDLHFRQLIKEAGMAEKAVNEPIPLPALPIEGFPQKIRDIIDACSNVYRTPKDFWAGAVLAATGLAIGDKLELKGKYENLPVLWMMLVGDVSSGKTNPLDFCLHWFKKHDSKSIKEYNKKMDEYKRMQSMTTQERFNGGMKEKLEAPECFQYLLNDFTPEAMVAVHMVNNRGMGIVRDELKGWIDDFGRYNQSGEQSNMLSSWSGIGITYNRKTSGIMNIERPVIMVTGGIQPDLLPSLANDNRAENGFLSRFCAVYPDNALKAEYNEEVLDYQVKRDWEEILEKLTSLEVPVTLKLSSEAQELYRDWYNLNAKMTNEESSGYLRGVYAKLDIIALRLAIILRGMYLACEGDYSEEISGTEMKAALGVTEYFRGTALKVCKRIFENTKSTEINKRAVARYLFNVLGYPKSEIARILKTSRSQVDRMLGNDRLAEEPQGELIPVISDESHVELIPRIEDQRKLISDESHGELIPRIADELNEKIGELVGETC